MKQFLLNADGSRPQGTNYDILEQEGYILVVPTDPLSIIPSDFSDRYHKLVELDAELVDEVYYQKWAVVEKTDEEKTEYENKMADAGRDIRNSLLLEVDKVTSNPLRWASLSEETQQAIADYRLALLDVPQQEGFPFEVVWPKNPSIE